MILLDTDVISEPLRRAPNERVVERIDTQPLETLYLSIVTVAEAQGATIATADGFIAAINPWQS